jgi:hypothetical protein
VKDGRLKYVYNFIGELEQIFESNETIPSGHVVFSANFELEGDTMPTQGTLNPYPGHPGPKGREASIRTQPGKFGLGGGGLVVGRSGAEPVTNDTQAMRPGRSSGARASASLSTSAAKLSSTWPQKHTPG